MRAPALLAGVAAVAAATALGCLESTPAPVTDDPSLYDPLGDAGGARDAAPDLAPDAAPDFDGAAVDVSDDADVDADAARWAGTWAYVSGSSGLECDGSFVVAASSGVLVIAATDMSHLTVQSNGCTFSFAVAGDVASIAPPNQACPLWAIPTIPEWTLTLRADGSMTEKLGGQIVYAGDECELGGGSTLERQ